MIGMGLSRLHASSVFRWQYNYNPDGEDNTLDYGTLFIHIDKILQEKGISKNRLCKDLDIPRTNLNRYCRGDFQRIDSGLVCKLCYYLDVDISELIEYIPPNHSDK